MRHHTKPYSLKIDLYYIDGLLYCCFTTSLCVLLVPVVYTDLTVVRQSSAIRPSC